MKAWHRVNSDEFRRWKITTPVPVFLYADGHKMFGVIEWVADGSLHFTGWDHAGVEVGFPLDENDFVKQITDEGGLPNEDESGTNHD